jgi:hypothetical protein
MKTRGWRHLVGAAGLAALVAGGGCLKAEKTHSLYVAPDGTLTWVVVEKDVYSDEKDPAKREVEEQQYIALARTGAHPVADAFRRLGAPALSTRVVRDDPPFLVITTARFASLDAMAQAFLDTMGAGGISHAETGGGQTRWAMTIWSVALVDEPAADALTPLWDEPWRVVLERGRFVAAEGFRLHEGGRTAVMLDRDEDPTPDKPMVWSLTWEAGS